MKKRERREKDFMEEKFRINRGKVNKICEDTIDFWTKKYGGTNMLTILVVIEMLKKTLIELVTNKNPAKIKLKRG